jgi:hypothetical protein
VFQENVPEKDIIPGESRALELRRYVAGLHRQFVVSRPQEATWYSEAGRNPGIGPIPHGKVAQEVIVQENNIGWLMALQFHAQFPGSLLGTFDVKATLPRHARIPGPVQGPKGRSLAIPKMNFFVWSEGEDW